MKKILKIPFKRRLKRKTNYNSRRYLLLGDTPRLVVRRTNRYLIAQIVESKEAQDKVVSTTTSKELLKYGFGGFSIKNLGGAYLTGFLAASKVKKNIKNAIIDIGMLKSMKKGRLYAVLKGAIDGGLKIPHSEDIIPSMEEIKKKTKIDIDNIKDKIMEKFK